MTLKEMRQSQVQIKYESQNEKHRSPRRRQGCVIYLIHPLWQLSGWPSLLVYCLAAHQRGSHGLVRVIIQMDSPGQTMAWIISDKIPPIHDSSTDSLSMPTDLPGSARVSNGYLTGATGPTTQFHWGESIQSGIYQWWLERTITRLQFVQEGHCKNFSIIGHCVLGTFQNFSYSVPTCPGSSRASRLLKKLFVVEGCWRCFVVVDVEVASAAAGTCRGSRCVSSCGNL